MYELLRGHKKVLVILLVFFITVIVTLLMHSSNKNPYGEELQIANLSTLTRGKPVKSDSLRQIKHNLYEIIMRNYKEDIRSNSIKDILVRDGSFTQTYDEKSDTHFVSFIADIASIKQSYDVRYQWTSKPEEEQNGEGQYGTVVSCLPLDQLLYGDFNCRDLFSDMRGSVSPYVSVDWWSAEDTNGYTLDSQLDYYETRYIEEQIAGDYDYHVKLRTVGNNATISKIERLIGEDVNTLSFEINLKDISYDVNIDFGNNRSIEIVNLRNGLKI